MAPKTLFQPLVGLARTATRSAGDTLTILVLTLGLVFAAAAVVLHFLVGLSLHVVLSGSMVPTYSPGDLIVTRVVDTSTLRSGQVAMFTPPEQDAPVAHRIVTIRTADDGSRVLITKGDANPTADLWTSILVEPEVPVHVGTIPRLGTPLLHLRTPQARAAAVAVVGGLLTTLFAAGIVFRPTCQCPECAEQS